MKLIERNDFKLKRLRPTTPPMPSNSPNCACLMDVRPVPSSRNLLLSRFMDFVTPVNNRVIPGTTSDLVAVPPEENVSISSEQIHSAVLVDLPFQCKEVDEESLPQNYTDMHHLSYGNVHIGENSHQHLSSLHHNGLIHKRRNIMRNLFHVWDSRLSLKMFGTKRRIIEEQERQESCTHWVIHPCSKFRIVWDIIMLLILAVNVTLLPVTVAFFDNSINPGWIVLNALSDLVFIIDIFLNFWTGIITTDNTVVLDLCQIRRAYFKKWLPIDFVAVFPFDYIALFVTHIKSMKSLLKASRALRILRMMRLLSLIRLLRVARFMRYLAKWEEFFNATKSVLRIINLVLIMLMLAHWDGCIQFLIPYLQDFPHNSWVTINRLTESSVFVQYTWSLFKATSHMICIGYGRFPPQNSIEVWMTIISMLIGASFYAMFIGHISTLIYSVDSSSRQYNERIRQVEEYMRYRRLPFELRQQVHEYYFHKYNGQFFNEQNILSELSHSLKERIVSHNCQDLVKIVPFFANADEAFITSIITRLTFEVFLPGDLIIRQGSFGSKMYFIQQGVVDVITTQNRVAATLSDGSYFGEICLLLKCRRVSSVKAVTMCDLYALSNDDFQHVLNEFPFMRKQMETIAGERLLLINSMCRSSLQEQQDFQTQTLYLSTVPSTSLHNDTSQEIA